MLRRPVELKTDYGRFESRNWIGATKQWFRLSQIAVCDVLGRKSPTT